MLERARRIEDYFALEWRAPPFLAHRARQGNRI
jgi:hypothetical protein